MKKFKSKLLSLLSKNLRKNKAKDYPQLWYYMPRSKKHPHIRKAIQWLCGFILGHEFSKTEWGYGGGDRADRWCRWCDKLISVPKESILFQYPEAKDLMRMVGKSGDEKD